MATETFVIQIVERGAAPTAAAIDNIGKSAERTTSVLRFFRQALVALAAVRAVQGFVEFADAAARIDNRLRTATKSTEEFNRAQQFLRDLSRQTRTDIEANAVSYSRLLRSTEGLSFTTKQLEDAQKAMSLAIKVGGATSQEARNAIIQFTQGLASGAVRGDELRSVAEQLPALADAIGKEFGMAGGQLIAFAKANPGILETERVVRGVIKALPELQRQAALITPTMSEGFTVIRNAIIEMLQDVNQTISVFGFFNRVLVFFADNIKLIAELAILFVTAWSVAKLAPILSWFVQVIQLHLALIRVLGLATIAQYAFNLAVSANPYVLIGVAIVTLVGLFLVLYNHLEIVRVAFYLVGQGLAYVWNLLMQAATAVATYLTPAFNILVNALIYLLPFAQAIWEAFLAIGNVVTTVVLAPMSLLWDVFVRLFGASSVLLPYIELLAQAIGVLLYAAVFTVLTVLTGLVQIMAFLGIVTQDTADKVLKAYVAYSNLAPAVLGVTTATREQIPEMTSLNETLAEVEVNYRKVADAAAKQTGATKGSTKATIEEKIAKRELNNELKEEIKWREMATGKTQAGWAAYDRLASSTRASSSAASDATGSYTGLAGAIGSTGSSALSTSSSVNTLTGAVSRSASAASQAANAYRSMANAASSAGSGGGGGGGIMDSPFFGNMSSGTASFSTVRSATAAETALANQVKSNAEALYAAGQLSQSEYAKALNDAQMVLDNKIPIGYYGRTVGSQAAVDPTGLLLRRANEYQDKLNDIERNRVMAEAASKPSSVKDFQTYTPWQTTAGFDTGGVFRVPGNRGDTDTKMAALRLSPGEEVEIRAANKRKQEEGEGSGDRTQINLNMYITATDVDSFRRNQAQVEAGMYQAVARHARRLNK